MACVLVGVASNGGVVGDSCMSYDDVLVSQQQQQQYFSHEQPQHNSASLGLSSSSSVSAGGGDNKHTSTAATHSSHIPVSAMLIQYYLISCQCIYISYY